MKGWVWAKGCLKCGLRGVVGEGNGWVKGWVKEWRRGGNVYVTRVKVDIIIIINYPSLGPRPANTYVHSRV